ncbi:hypothetical protein IW262DRAFT_1459547 [Armillaria fumosa]|nr:hypothetical protein IW262DRAFT_1459547 [Armillaria fumosa]
MSSSSRIQLLLQSQSSKVPGYTAPDTGTVVAKLPRMSSRPYEEPCGNEPGENGCRSKDRDVLPPKLFAGCSRHTHIQDILRLIPALATLKFHFRSRVGKENEERIFSEMFRRMTETRDNGIHKIVVVLEEFSFTIWPYNDDDEAKWDSVRCIDSAFVEMLVSRAGTKLSKVKVESSVFIPRHFSREDIRTLKSLGSRGLKVSISGFDIFPPLY